VIFKLFLPSVEKSTRQRSSLPNALFLTLSKELLCRVSKMPSVKNKILGKELLRRVFSFTEGFLRGTQQRDFFAGY
jgi:hypothetical protein